MRIGILKYDDVFFKQIYSGHNKYKIELKVDKVEVHNFRWRQELLRTKIFSILKYQVIQNSA